MGVLGEFCFGWAGEDGGGVVEAAAADVVEIVDATHSWCGGLVLIRWYTVGLDTCCCVF